MRNLFDILFLSFSINIIIFSIFTITASNSIQGLIALIFTFIGTAFLFFLMELEFISLLILIVYIGAISVLFLFSVLLFNLKEVVRTKNNNLILKSFFLIFLLFLFIYLLVLFSVMFQKNSDFLLFFVDYDFLYYQNRIIYTFFDQKNEILNYINSILANVFDSISISDNFFLYKNTHLNINTDLYILGCCLYEIYIVYFILTGLILLIGMFGAISLINNQKPITQLQHLNRQVSTNLAHRGVLYSGTPPDFYNWIINYNFQSTIKNEYNNLMLELMDHPIKSFIMFVLLIIFLYFLLVKLKNNPTGFYNLIFIRILRIILSYIGVSIVFEGISFLSSLKKYIEIFIILSMLILLIIVKLFYPSVVKSYNFDFLPWIVALDNKKKKLRHSFLGLSSKN